MSYNSVYGNTCSSSPPPYHKFIGPHNTLKQQRCLLMSSCFLAEVPSFPLLSLVEVLPRGINTAWKSFRTVLIPRGSTSAQYYHCGEGLARSNNTAGDGHPHGINTARKSFRVVLIPRRRTSAQY